MRTRQLLLVVATSLLSIVGGISFAGAISKSPVSIRVSLETTTMVAGHPIHGTATLTNSSPKTILVQACASDGWLFVGLTNKNVPYDPAVAAVACNATIHLKPGPNRFPIVVSTEYQVCEGRGTPASALHGTPRCTKTGAPSLPRGTYRIDVITLGLPKGTQESPRISVTLS